MYGTEKGSRDANCLMLKRATEVPNEWRQKGFERFQMYGTKKGYTGAKCLTLKRD